MRPVLTPDDVPALLDTLQPRRTDKDIAEEIRKAEEDKGVSWEPTGFAIVEESE